MNITLANPQLGQKIEVKMNESKDKCNWKWRRGSVAVTVFLMLCYLQTALMRPNTTFEHHPFSGPLIVFSVNSLFSNEFCAGVLMFIVLGAGICLPWFRFNIASAITAISAVCVWIAISWTLGMMAAC